MIVENDVNALAVLAIHEVHYTDRDLVVVGVFDEGVGGGLVMGHGGLRRGDGRAMEIGHLAVGFPPGQDPEQNLPTGSRTGYVPAATGFRARCSCGQLGHVQSPSATPSRVEAFDGGTLEQISQIDARGHGVQASTGRIRAWRCRPRPAGACQQHRQPEQGNHANLPPSLAAAEHKPHTAGAGSHCRQNRDHPAWAVMSPITVGSAPSPPASRMPRCWSTSRSGVRAKSFIEHALRLYGCKPGPRRGSQGLPPGVRMGRGSEPRRLGNRVRECPHPEVPRPRGRRGRDHRPDHHHHRVPDAPLLLRADLTMKGATRSRLERVELAERGPASSVT